MKRVCYNIVSMGKQIEKFIEKNEKYKIVLEEKLQFLWKDLNSNLEVKWRNLKSKLQNSENNEVFERVDNLIDWCIKHDMNVFYDATNINKKYRRKFVNQFKDKDNVKIIYLVFPADVELSNKRIRKDMSDGVDRSDVPYEVLERQMKLYKETIEKGFEDENVQEVIYL